MTDAMQTIREALEWYANPNHYDKDDWGVHSVIQPPEYGDPGKIAREALTALDSLAVEPSEEYVPMLHGKSEIESHDERIRKECADRAEESMYGDMYNWELAKMRAAILGTKPAQDDGEAVK